MASPEGSASPIRIVHVITGLGTGGAEHTLLKLVRGLQPDRFRHTVVSLVAPGALGPEMMAAGATVRTLNMRPGRPNPLGIVALAHWLRAERPHLVQTWLPHADLLGGLAAKLGGRPSVVWNIRYTHIRVPGRRGAVSWIIRLCVALSSWLPTQIVSCTRRGAAFYGGLGYDESRLRVIPNGYDTSRFRPDADARAALRAELGLPAHAIVVGMAARFDPLKDHANLVAAALLVAKQNAAVHFVLCGDGITWQNSELAEGITSHRERFHLLGPRADVHRVLAGFDVNVLCSISEGFPNAVAEAMACGVPCIVTDVGDAAWIVADTGRVVPPRNSTALAEELTALIDGGADMRNALGHAARARIETEFSLETMLGRYEDLYGELAGHVRN